MLLMTIVAVVVSLVLILHSKNAEQQHKHVKHFVTMMAATTAGAKRTNEEVDDDNTGRRKRRMIKYNCEHTNRCIQQDYLGPSPIMNHHKFQQVFHISSGMHNCIKNEMKGHEFYNVGDYDITGCPTISIDAHVHGVLGMLGSLDCMHVCWKNCPGVFQELYQGKEKYATMVLEAVADNNLWF